MATKSSFWLRGKKGRLAGTTVYTSKGRTIQREIVDVANPQTRAQMEQRVKWPNLVNFYKVMRPVLKCAFENKKQAQSDYNALMSINASRDKVPYITKSEARQGFVAHAPFQITQGTLGSITFGIDSTASIVMSTLVLAPSFDIDEDTTIGEVSTAILAANAEIRIGMQVSFVMLKGGEDGIVKNVTLVKEEFLINPDSEDKLSDYAPSLEAVTIAGSNVKYIGTNINVGPAVSAAFILSETISGKTKVSTESMVLNSEASAQYGVASSATSLNAAILSYGVAENAFLNSTEANKA